MFNILSFVLLSLSILEIEIKKIKIDTQNKTNEFLIYLRFKLLKKITWVKIKIDNEKINKFKTMNNKIIDKISKGLKRQVKDKKNLTSIKILEFKVKEVNLDLKVGLLDPIITAFITTIISTLLSNIFVKRMEEYSRKNCKYKIEPKFVLNPEFKLDGNCIIYVKMVHIISVIYMLSRKESEKDGNFSPNRRNYEGFNV